MTKYIASYDTESPSCLAHCRTIVQMHHHHNIPATFFITGETLYANSSEYRELLDDPLFEVASHTYSHRMLLDHPWCGPAASAEKIAKEIDRGKEIVEDVFGRACVGLRPGCSFENGLLGAGDVLGLINEAGYKYVSSKAWGADYSLPAPLSQQFTYGDDGYDNLWELPCHGWHENLLKNHNRWEAKRLTLWPPEMPEAIPDKFIETPEDEFGINRVFIDRAKEDKLTFVSLIWHPWSLGKFDPEMKMLDLTFSYVKRSGLEPITYSDLLASVRG